MRLTERQADAPSFLWKHESSPDSETICARKCSSTGLCPKRNAIRLCETLRLGGLCVKCGRDYGPAVNTAHAISFFDEPTSRVCVVERRFDNSGQGRFGIRTMKKNGPASSYFVRSARKLKPQIYADETTDQSWTTLSAIVTEYRRKTVGRANLKSLVSHELARKMMAIVRSIVTKSKKARENKMLSRASLK